MEGVPEELLRRVDTFVQNDSRFFQTVSELKNIGQNQEIEWLQRFECYNIVEIMNYRDYLVLTKYLEGSPFGVKYSNVYYNLACIACYLPQEINGGIAYFNDIYNASIMKEMVDADIYSISAWIHAYSELKKYPQLNLQEFSQVLSTKVSMILWNIIADITEAFSNKTIGIYLDALASASIAGLEVETTSESLLNSIYDFFSLRFDIYKPNEQWFSQENMNIQILISKFKLMKFSDIDSKIKVAELENYFGVYFEEEPYEEIVFIKSDNNYIYFDNKEFRYVKDLYLNPKNKKFDIKIILMENKSNYKIAVKEYTTKGKIEDIYNVYKEIDILEMISKFSSPLNCFIKYYGCKMDATKIYFAMEYYPDSLMDKLVEMKKKKLNFNEDHMKYYANCLLEAFAFLEQKGIYHQDIKPHNILITEEWKLKIIDFSISLQKEPNLDNASNTDVHRIQGTQGYMAPELEYNHKDPPEKIKFRRGAADVFSLGLTILQMCTLEDLFTLNSFENSQRLLEKVSCLKIEWLKTLLLKMLNADFRLRPKFKDCLQYIPTEARLKTIQEV